MSIRLRLTLLYSAILAVTLIAFGVILYATQSRTTFGSIRADLVRQASFIAGGPALAPTDGGQGEGIAPPPRPPAIGSPDGELPGRWTQTISLDGAVVARSRDLSDAALPLSPSGLQAVANGSSWFETAELDGEPLLIYSQPFTNTDGEDLVVQTGFPIAQTQQSLGTLRLLLLGGSSLAIVVAFLAGWALAGAALRPVDRITRTAGAIGAERDFSRRVEHKGPKDEVGRLAVTLNAMLAELESAYRQLEGALDSQRRFVADASHELRTPLTTVRGNVELLQREPPLAPEERAEIMADTTSEVDRLIRLVNQLLVLARVDAGQPLDGEPLEVGPLIEEVCRQVRLLAPDRKILCDATTDVNALGDRDALKQVLLILMDNALVHTPSGTEIILSARLSGGCPQIAVLDAGPGIPAEALPHIFDRFYRGAPSRSGPGAGLGLAIARELVEAQDGTISVASPPGDGTTFTITLPAAPA